MAIIETKYNIGDVVYSGHAHHTTSTIECPDCAGSKVIHVIFSGDRKEEVQCVTCKSCWGQSTGRIEKSDVTVSVSRLTIGSVEYGKERGARYMCDETGIGSGNIYYEDNIFVTKEGAEAYGEKLREQYLVNIAENNFKKKGKFAELLQRHVGYARNEAFKMEAEMRTWIKAVRRENKK